MITKDMIKRILVAIILLIVSLAAVYPTIFLTQNFYLTKSYSIENDVELNTEDTKFIRCNYNILRPKFAYAFPFSDGVHVSFLESEGLFNQNEVEWHNSEIGGTTVENTTFSELVKMLKEDCIQFQKSKGNYYDESMNWSYSEYVPEPVLTPEGQKEKKRRDLADRLRMELEWYSEEELQYVKKTYGMTKKAMDKELIEWHEKGVRDGYFEE